MDAQATVVDVPSEAVRGLLEQAGERGAFEMQAIQGGGNNRVFRLSVGPRSFLLKAYFRHPGDTRDRLGAEFAFTRFAWKQGIRRGPQPLAMDADHGLGLYEFIAGRKLDPGEVDAAAVAQALALFQELNRQRHLAEAQELPAGSEACFRLADHLHCVERRLGRFDHWQPRTDLDRQAKAFVRGDIRPRWHDLCARLEKEFREAGLDPEATLALARRCLSPSDFGFHNALLEPAGTLRFIDFEYAGWDDPAKVACDFFCQPAVPVPHEFWPMFVAALTVDFPDRERRRIELLLPVYQMKWVTIMLNDFLATGDQRRRFARPDQDPDKRRQEQLDKARQFLGRVRFAT